MEERAVTTTTYDAKDGQQVTLTFDTITKYLVQGHPEYVTRQEMMFFMGICKSRGLNPFAKDCYLIKYSQRDGAAIITAIDYFRKRARAQIDCKGWKKGIIVQRKGEIVYTDGLMLEDDTLLGGWFKAKPEGWDEPFTLEVNLKGYIKKTKEGSITKFWQKENQPTQIAKVAESQGLRTLWPDEFQQLYTQEELGEADTFKTVGEMLSSEENSETDLVKQFEDSIPKETNQDHLNQFLNLCVTADPEAETFEDIKAQAVPQLDNFWKQFHKWEEDIKKPDSRKSTLSEQEQEVYNGFIHIRKQETLRGTEQILIKEMPSWSKELRKEWSDKWLRIMREPYEFEFENKQTKPEEELTETTSGLPGRPVGDPDTSQEIPEEHRDPDYMIKHCPETGEKVNVDYCDEVCPKKDECEAYRDFKNS